MIYTITFIFTLPMQYNYINLHALFIAKEQKVNF